MLKETDEQFHQMDLEDYFNNDVKSNLFAVSRIFAEARKQMNLAEYKTFTYALTNIKWTEPCPDTIYLDKNTVATIIGLECDTTDLSQHLKRAIGDMPAHSYLRFSSKDLRSGEWINGNFVRTVAYLKNRIRIKLEPDFLGLFGNLEKNYITMWSSDIYRMHSERAIKFYELLRENSDTRIDINEGTVGIKKFKELFDIPKDGPGSYMREQKNGSFNRTNFERRVIDPVCEDLAHTDMITLLLQPNGKYYEKVKKGGRVIGYKFFWTLSMHPAVASAKAVKKIQERVDKDPKVLKVAKNIVEGKPKPKAKNKCENCSKATRFSNFSQRKMNDDLQKKLIQASMASKSSETEQELMDRKLAEMETTEMEKK